MAINANIEEIRDLDDEALVIKLRESKEELFNLRFQAATGQLESHGSTPSCVSASSALLPTKAVPHE